MTTEEDLIVMNNGCVCCTIRGDLIKTLNDLLRRPEKFDAILIETTGVGDPSPVIQSFFVDEDLKAKLRLDAVITLVDSRHIWQHLDANREAREQIAYGDVVLLNKTDLATADDLDRLEKRVRELNVLAKIYRTKDAEIALDRSWTSAPSTSRGGSGVSPELKTADQHHEAFRHPVASPAAVGGARREEVQTSLLGKLHMTRGTDIFRMKRHRGVQHGEARRDVFQGVHHDVSTAAPTGPAARRGPFRHPGSSSGPQPAEQELRDGLLSCRA
jgi:G3E family GTPase